MAKLASDMNVQDIVVSSEFVDGQGALDFQRVKTNKFDGIVIARTDRGTPEAVNFVIRRFKQSAWHLVGLEGSGMEIFDDVEAEYNPDRGMKIGEVTRKDTPKGILVVAWAETQDEAELMAYMAAGLIDEVPESLALSAMAKIQKRAGWSNRKAYSQSPCLVELLNRWTEQGKLNLPPFPPRIEEPKGTPGRKSGGPSPAEIAQQQGVDVAGLNDLVSDLF